MHLLIKISVKIDLFVVVIDEWLLIKTFHFRPYKPSFFGRTIYSLHPVHNHTIMIFFLFASLIAVVSCAIRPFAHETFGSRCNSDLSYKCGLALHQMVYQPTTCTMHYLERISRQLQLQSPLLFTQLATSVITTFAAQNGVTVFITDAFGINSPYPPPNSGSFTSLPPGFTETNGVSVSNFMAMFTSTAQANVIGQGFMNQDGYTYYTFVVWSNRGQLLYVNVGITTTNQFC